MAEFKLDVVRHPGLTGGEWTVTLRHHEKPRARWKVLTYSQGKTLSEALAACQYATKQQEKQHPELWL